MMSIKAVRVILLCTLILLSSLLIWNFFFSKYLLTEQLRVRDGSIIDGSGRVVVLRGLNYLEITNCLQRLPNISELIQIKVWGFNVIRLPVYWECLEPEQGIVNYTFVKDYIDSVVKWCQNNSIYLILDMHRSIDRTIKMVEPAPITVTIPVPKILSTKPTLT